MSFDTGKQSVKTNGTVYIAFKIDNIYVLAKQKKPFNYWFNLKRL